MIKNIKIDNLDDQTRIDRWLKRNFSSLSQSFIEKNLRKGLIKLNHNKVQAKYKVVKNDIINIFNYSENIYSSIIEKTSNKKIPNKILKKFRDSIIFENKDFMILNKWDKINKMYILLHDQRHVVMGIIFRRSKKKKKFPSR